MTIDAPTFDWANLPADLVRAFARALVGGRPDTESAFGVLRREVGVPDSDFFRDYRIRGVAAETWLPADDAALDHVYGALRGRAIPGRGRGTLPSGRTKLSAVRKLVDPPVGARQTEPVRLA